MTGQPGTLYLLHFEPAYRHAGHYLGWTQNPVQRFATHLAGRGSPLVKAALGAGCVVTTAILGPGDRYDERRLHNEKHSARHCPTCRGEA